MGNLSVRPLQLYAEKVEEPEVAAFFNNILKNRYPFLGLVDLSPLCAPFFSTLIIERVHNTFHMYIKDKPVFRTMSHLLFPFSLDEPIEYTKKGGRWLPCPRMYILNSSNFVDFMLKEQVSEIRFSLNNLLFRQFAIGVTTHDDGRKGLVLLLNPSKFLTVDLENHPSIYLDVLDPIPKQIAMRSKHPIFEAVGTSIGVDNFDIFQHTLIVGSSGVGKSKLIYIIAKAILTAYPDVHVVLVDPHGEMKKAFDKEAYIIDFKNNYIDPLELTEEKTPLMTQLVAQIINSSIGADNRHVERILFYVTFLLTELDMLSLENISKVITDEATRMELVSRSESDEVKRFFDEEYNDIEMKFYNQAILPILNFISEYNLYVGGEKKKENLLDIIKKYRLVVVTFDPKFFGKRMIKFFASAISNQMYVYAITEQLDKPTIYILDEFPRVEARMIKDMLAETRKFNLLVYLSCQYLGQLSKEVRDSVISNIRNIISFKVNREDAALLSSIMEIKVEEYFKKSRSQTEIEEAKREMFIRLHQRQVIARLFDGRHYLLPMKLEVVNVKKWQAVPYKNTVQTKTTIKVPKRASNDAKPQ